MRVNIYKTRKCDSVGGCSVKYQFHGVNEAGSDRIVRRSNELRTRGTVTQRVVSCMEVPAY